MQKYSFQFRIKLIIQNNYYFCIDFDFDFTLRSLFMWNTYQKILQKRTEMRLSILEQTHFF